MNKFFLAVLFLFAIFFIGYVSANTITVVRPANNTNYSGTTVFNVSYVNGTDYSDARNATFYYNLSGVWTYLGFAGACANGATFGSCNTTLTIPPTMEGKYSINATLGNNTAFGASVITTNVMLDSKAPGVSFSGQTNAINKGNYSGTVILNVSVNDGGMGVESVYFTIINPLGAPISLTKASGSGGYYNISFATAGLIDGAYNISIWANDTQLNNINLTELITIIVDNTAPTGGFSCTPAKVTVGTSTSCSCGGSDATSGVRATSFNSNPPTTQTGTFTQTCVVTDYAGNSISVNAVYVVEPSGGVLKPKTITPTTPATSAEILVKKLETWTKITPGVAVIMKDFDTEMGIKQIQIEVNNEAQNVQITVDKYETKPAQVLVSKEGVYKYLHIETQNLSDKLSNATIEIRVEKSWVSVNSLSKGDLALFRFDESSQKWNELTTTFKSEDSTYYYYDTQLNSFSYFAIAPKEIKEGISSTLIWTIVLTVILVVLIGTWFALKRKKRK